jgi:bifunctional DNA-binding transcriptional regulator/antitoxin component of YhaV-PrlF toxin-antitoxin module
MISARLDTDGKLALPQDVLELLGLEPGDELVIELMDGRAVITRAPQSADLEEEAAVQAAIDEYLKNPGPTYPVEEVRARLHARFETRARGRDAA